MTSAHNERGGGAWSAARAIHDYYSGALAVGGINVLPTGFSTEGNEYCRARGMLTPEETAAIAKATAPRPPGTEQAPIYTLQEKRPWHWRYHFGLPRDEYWPMDPSKPGGPEIHIVFFDSAALVRAAENCAGRPVQCPPAAAAAADDPLSCMRALESLCRLRALLDSEKTHPSIAWRVFVAHHPFWTVGAHGGYSWSAVEGEAEWHDRCSKAVDPQSWFLNTQFDPEDECSRGWRWYVEQLTKIMKGRPPFDVALMGHDHSLQLIQPSDTRATALARIEIVSGAGSRTSVVRGPGPRLARRPHLERVYTAATTSQGRSRAGFVALRFHVDKAEVQFFEGAERLPAQAMAPPREAPVWEGKSCFVVDRAGTIDPAAPCDW